MDTFDYQEYLRNNPLLENLNEEMGDVKAAWPKLTDDQKIDLLTGVWDDPDEAEKHFEKDFDNLPEAAKQNMYMDMMRSDLKEEEGEEEGWVNFNKASSNIENVDKEETFGIGNMKQAYNVGHYIGRTYRNRKTISQEKEKGWKDLLRSYDPPVKDTTSENLNEIDVDNDALPQFRDEFDSNPSFDYERKIVHKVIDGVANDFSGEEMLTREYIDSIITALEELKTTDF